MLLNWNKEKVLIKVVSRASYHRLSSTRTVVNSHWWITLIIIIIIISLAESFYFVKYGLSNIMSIILSNNVLFYEFPDIFFKQSEILVFFDTVLGFNLRKNLVEKANNYNQQLNTYLTEYLTIHIWRSRNTLLLFSKRLMLYVICNYIASLHNRW